MTIEDLKRVVLREKESGAYHIILTMPKPKGFSAFRPLKTPFGLADPLRSTVDTVTFCIEIDKVLVWMKKHRIR